MLITVTLTDIQAQKPLNTIENMDDDDQDIMQVEKQEMNKYYAQRTDKLFLFFRNKALYANVAL